MPEASTLTPVIDDERATVYLGDTVAVLPLLPASSVDSVVTDPPYGLGFADQEWDGAKGFRESLTSLDTSGMRWLVHLVTPGAVWCWSRSPGPAPPSRRRCWTGTA